MVSVTLHMEDVVRLFYERIAEAAGLSVERVMEDALFRLAGEMAISAGV